jgi:Circadian oscillating protein COP23
MLFTNKTKIVGILLGTGISLVTISTAQSQTNPSQTNPTQTGFSCNTSEDVPTTVYKNKQGIQEPWIKWSSDYFSDSGWTPQSRCQEVSNRLENYRRNNQLKYVTLGTVKNQTVICVANAKQAPCAGVIYTLKPGQNAIAALNNLFAWRKGEAGLQSSYETMEIPYIEVGSRL